MAPSEYWGYLVKPDKTPSPVFEQLLLGIANYIVRGNFPIQFTANRDVLLTVPVMQNRNIAPWDTMCLTPTKLAAFYRLVGGDYDPFFLDTPQASLSFIYQSLGCYHTLQPERDPSMPPSIPALTPQGFVRWQTVQLLLQPEDHVPFLQAAVKRFEITNPGDGAPFPKILPKEALPNKPDLDMIQWHENVAEKLRIEAQAYQGRGEPMAALSDEDPEGSVTSSVYSQSIGNPTSYAFGPRSHHSVYAASSNRHAASTAPHLPWQHPQHLSQEHPWTAERRRTDMLSPNYPSHPSTWRPDGATPTGRRSPDVPIHHRSESSETISTVSSSSSSSSLTTSSASLSPVLRSSQPHMQSIPTLNRRHSMSHSHDAHRYAYDNPHHPPRPRPQTSYFPQSPPRNPNPPRTGTRGHHVRWRDVNDEFQFPHSAPGTPNGEAWVPHGEAGREHRRLYESEDEKTRRMVSPLRGVGGRRYANDGMSGR